MTDKERILTYLFISFYPKYILNIKGKPFDELTAENIEIGDLVVSMTTGINEFTVGYVINKFNDYHMLVREIGSNTMCNIENDMFYKIDTSNLNYNLLLDGFEYQFYLKTEKAFQIFSENIGTEEDYILMETVFNQNEVKIYFRKRWEDYTRNTAAAVVSFLYNKKTTLKFMINEFDKQLNNTE